MTKQKLTTQQLARKLVRDLRQAGLDLICLEGARGRREACARYRKWFAILAGARAR